MLSEHEIDAHYVVSCLSPSLGSWEAGFLLSAGHAAASAPCPVRLLLSGLFKGGLHAVLCTDWASARFP